MKLLVLLPVLLLTACASTSYKPVAPADFDDLVRDGCQVSPSRFNVSAQISAAYKETVVLWDGIDPSKTAAVRLPEEGFGSKARGLVGESRYDVNLRILRGLRGTAEPVTLALQCDAKDRAPRLLRLRYIADGDEREIEFDN